MTSTVIRKKRILFAVLIPVLLPALLFMPLNTEIVQAASSAPFTYVHDPMLNAKAAADIIADPTAVYGYRPNPDSVRLGEYAKYDWTDAAVVANMRAQREAYHESMKDLYILKATLEAEGKTIEETARTLSTRRNEIRMESYKDDPEGLASVKASNLASFQNENGPTPEFLYAKYGSWEVVIEKVFSTNVGADACLGLYDIYYGTYLFDRVRIDRAKVVLSRVTFSYNGRVQKPEVRTIGGKVLKEGIDYMLQWSAPSSKNAGTYQVSVIGKDDYTGTAKAAYTIKKAANPLKIRVSKKTCKRSKLKKAVSFRIGATKAIGKVSYSLDKKAKKARIKVNGSGKVTIPKNCKPGTYRITVKAAGNRNYKSGKKIVTITVKKGSV